MTPRLSRRAFAIRLAVLATSCTIAVIPRVVQAQQSVSPRRIGVLLAARLPQAKELQAFRSGLKDAGYSEGRDLTIEWRFAGGDYARVPEFVAELVQSKVEVIVVDTTVATKAVKRATSTIPVVMTSIADPVGSGLVASLAHPGGNITGLSLMMPDISGKQLQLLKEVVPEATRVAVLWNPETPYSQSMIASLKSVAPSLSVELKFVDAQSLQEINGAFSDINREHVQALYVIEDPLYMTHRPTLLKLASKARLPVMYGERTFADAGALISYGPSYRDLFRRAADYVDKILKGAKPDELPIEQPTKFELVVNLKTARALGLSIPDSILLLADELIQ